MPQRPKETAEVAQRTPHDRELNRTMQQSADVPLPQGVEIAEAAQVVPGEQTLVLVQRRTVEQVVVNVPMEIPFIPPTLALKISHS